jgi:hypothetical protein
MESPGGVVRASGKDVRSRVPVREALPTPVARLKKPVTYMSLCGRGLRRHIQRPARLGVRGQVGEVNTRMTFRRIR